MNNVYKILVGNPEGKMPLGKLRHRQEDELHSSSDKQNKKCLQSFGGENS
jgi:hypothetical protein